VGFIAFLLVVVVMLFIVVPRATPPRAHVASGIGSAVLGLFTGVLAGLLGVGGGVIVVPRSSCCSARAT
jgi:uncharacterized membrane protein YfcA